MYWYVSNNWFSEKKKPDLSYFPNFSSTDTSTVTDYCTDSTEHGVGKRYIGHCLQHPTGACYMNIA